MKTTVTSQTDTEAKLQIIVDEEQLKHALAASYRELRPKVKAAGFRPGKAPDSIVERELGSATVQSEAIEHAVAETYSTAIRDHNLRAIGQPTVTINKFVPYTELEYVAEVELMPEAKLGDYKGIRLKRESIKVEDSEIEATIEDLRRRQAARIASDLPAVIGDEVTFDFHGIKDGVDVPGATAKGHTLKLGSGQFIPGFEEKMIGMKKGDKKSFDITFPDDYHEESLRAQLVKFEVSVHDVTSLILPDVSADFIASVSPFKTLPELKSDIRERITAQKAESVAKEHEQKLLDRVLEISEYTAPKTLVAQQVRRLKVELEQNLAYSGLDLPKYLEMMKKTEDTLEQELRPEAEKRVGLALVLTAIAKAENIAVAEAELEDEIVRLKTQYPDPEMQAELDAPGTKEEVYNHLMASRVIAKLMSYAESSS